MTVFILWRVKKAGHKLEDIFQTKSKALEVKYELEHYQLITNRYQYVIETRGVIE